MKRTGKEIRNMIRALKTDYKQNPAYQHLKRKCYWRVVKNLLGLLWCNISAPFVYPVWYIFRKRTTELIDTKWQTWQEIKWHVENNRTAYVKTGIRNISYLLYWLWTYGDIDDPLGWGGMPEEYGRNTFWNRFRWSAIRNARFNWNYMELRSGTIIDSFTVTDTRNPNLLHISFGIGSQQDGVILKWFIDTDGKYYFIYEEANSDCIWYFGWVGLLKQGDIGHNGRFELSYRVTERTILNGKERV